MADFPELYEQLAQKHWFAFCQTQPPPGRGHSAILACPIFDDQVERYGILGDLWALKPRSSVFSEQEIHLLEQVANQCAVALRQARLYEASQNQVRELEHLNQLKDDFLSTISHELRSPLANMKMALQLLDVLTHQGQAFVEQLSQPVTTSQKAMQYFEILKQECDRELQLVQDLLDLQYLEADRTPMEHSTIYLQDWLPHVVETFQSCMQEQHQILELDIQPVAPVRLDLPSLSRIVSELLYNACKYTPAHGRITVGLGLQGDRVCFWVSNTGIEIAPQELSRIFEKFYRISNNDPWKYGGTGLGLALVKKLVERLGGAITVTSENCVTCFMVQFPVRNQGLG